jgi:hypothetical protein
MEPEEWNALPNTGARLGNPSTQTPTQRALAPAGTFPPLSAAWTPARQAETEAERYRETLRRAEAFHAEQMAAAAKRAKNAEINKIYAPLPIGTRQITNKTKAIKHYEEILEKLLEIQKLNIINNVKGQMGAFISGLIGMSIEKQIELVRKQIDILKSVHQNAGTRHRRKHSKRRFRVTRRKTT